MNTESGPGRPHELPIDPDVELEERLPGRPSSAAVVRDAVRDRWDVLLAVALGGAGGAAARYGIGTVAPYRSGEFPWGTFVVNVTGCLLIGVLMALVVEVWPTSRYVRPFAGVGVLGGYTTFSTYALESRDLLASGHGSTASAYVLGSVLAGSAAVALGILAVRVVVEDRPRRGAAR